MDVLRQLRPRKRKLNADPRGAGIFQKADELLQQAAVTLKLKSELAAHLQIVV
jgi:hypothetical protein